MLEAEENHLNSIIKNSHKKDCQAIEHYKNPVSSAYTICFDRALSTPKKIELLTLLENEIQNKATATEEGMLINNADESNGKEIQTINNLLLSLKKDNMA